LIFRYSFQFIKVFGQWSNIPFLFLFAFSKIKYACFLRSKAIRWVNYCQIKVVICKAF